MHLKSLEDLDPSGQQTDELLYHLINKKFYCLALKCRNRHKNAEKHRVSAKTKSTFRIHNYLFSAGHRFCLCNSTVIE